MVNFNLTSVLGGALALSLIGNLFLLKNSEHQVEKKAECVSAVKASNDIATTKKIVIERRQEVSKNEVQASVSKQLAVARRVYESRSRIGNLPGPTDTPTGSNGDPSPSPVLLPEDELICNTNTILAGAWPIWYSQQIKIRHEEEVKSANPTSNSVPSP